MLELIDRLKYLLDYYGDIPLYSVQSDIPSVLNGKERWRIGRLLGYLRPKINRILVASKPLDGSAPDTYNGFYIYSLPVGKRKPFFLNRSPEGMGSADCIAYLRRNFAKSLVELV